MSGKQMTKKAKPPLTITFVRHGEPGPYIPPHALGPRLTALGRRQAARVGRRLAKTRFDHIYASDLRRARETADAIVRFHPSTPYTVTADIREVLSDHHSATQKPRTKERRARVKRERAALETFARRVFHRHGLGRHILVVSHYCVTATLIPILAGADPFASPTLDHGHTAVAVFKTWKKPGHCIVVLSGCTRHLG